MSRKSTVKIPTQDKPFLVLQTNEKANFTRGECQFVINANPTLTQAQKLHQFIVAAELPIELASKRLAEMGEVTQEEETTNKSTQYRVSVDFKISSQQTATKEPVL